MDAVTVWILSRKKDNRKLSDQLKSLCAEAGKVTGNQMNQIEAVDDEDEVEGKNEKADRDFQFRQTPGSFFTPVKSNIPCRVLNRHQILL